MKTVRCVSVAVTYVELKLGSSAAEAGSIGMKLLMPDELEDLLLSATDFRDFRGGGGEKSGCCQDWVESMARGGTTSACRFPPWPCAPAPCGSGNDDWGA